MAAFQPGTVSVVSIDKLYFLYLELSRENFSSGSVKSRLKEWSLDLKWRITSVNQESGFYTFNILPLNKCGEFVFYIETQFPSFSAHRFTKYRENLC